MRVATALLASCALLVSVSVPSATPPPHCADGICELTIIVPAGCGSGIQVAPNPLRVDLGSKATTLKWVIRSKGWSFDTNGIVIEEARGLFVPTTKVDPKSPPVEFTVTNRHTSAASRGVFKYDINLEGPDGKCSHDPTVINQ